jgi:hypothetical protein
MTRLRIIVNLLAVAVIVFAAITIRARSRAQHRGESAADPLAILDRRVAEVDFAGTNLAEAADALAKAAGVRIAVDPAAAEIAGRVDASEIAPGGITLEENLQELITPINGLSYVVERKGIRITTSSRAPAVVRIYDVRDLQQKIIPTIPTDPVPLSQAAWAKSTAGLFVGAGPPPVPRKPTPAEIEEDAVDQIAANIRETVHRGDWTENGGTSASINYFGGYLAITQSPAAHRKITALLEAIRRADAMRWNEASGRRW